MTQYKRILCPVDLSENSLWAVEIATTMAKQHGAKMVFFYAVPFWLPEESLMGSEYAESMLAEAKAKFHSVHPADDAIDFEHVLMDGNPGPEIVRIAKTCDLVVMSTHGHSGIMRLLMGSVAQYTMRNADCPVILVKDPMTGKRRSEPEKEKGCSVTGVMHQVGPVQGKDDMESVIQQLERARETAVPVVDDFGECVGILTTTDIGVYRKLLKRFEEQDESVVNEIFETDSYGQRRSSSYDFNQVRRHMTSPVITISNIDSCKQARDKFIASPNIHHLVVVDGSNRPVGILETRDVEETKGLASGV